MLPETAFSVSQHDKNAHRGSMSPTIMNLVLSDSVLDENRQ